MEMLQTFQRFAFQSTHPVWGGTAGPITQTIHGGISIHPPRVGWDIDNICAKLDAIDFNPPTPCGVGPRADISCPRWSANFNPPTPCGVGRRDKNPNKTRGQFQSTHPVWGGTRFSNQSLGDSPDFNPPTPCGVGRDGRRGSQNGCHFNPPTPCGVGRNCWAYRLGVDDFNPPTPCGVGLIYNQWQEQ